MTTLSQDWISFTEKVQVTAIATLRDFLGKSVPCLMGIVSSYSLPKQSAYGDKGSPFSWFDLTFFKGLLHGCFWLFYT